MNNEGDVGADAPEGELHRRIQQCRYGVVSASEFGSASRELVLQSGWIPDHGAEALERTIGRVEDACASDVLGGPSAPVGGGKEGFHCIMMPNQSSMRFAILAAPPNDSTTTCCIVERDE